jgi:hypothetical protein
MPWFSLTDRRLADRGNEGYRLAHFRATIALVPPNSRATPASWDQEIPGSLDHSSASATYRRSGSLSAHRCLEEGTLGAFLTARGDTEPQDCYTGPLSVHATPSFSERSSHDCVDGTSDHSSLKGPCNSFSFLNLSIRRSIFSGRAKNFLLT